MSILADKDHSVRGEEIAGIFRDDVTRSIGNGYEKTFPAIRFVFRSGAIHEQTYLTDDARDQVFARLQEGM